MLRRKKFFHPWRLSCKSSLSPTSPFSLLKVFAFYLLAFSFSHSLSLSLSSTYAHPHLWLRKKKKVSLAFHLLALSLSLSVSLPLSLCLTQRSKQSRCRRAGTLCATQVVPSLCSPPTKYCNSKTTYKAGVLPDS